MSSSLGLYIQKEFAERNSRRQRELQEAKEFKNKIKERKCWNKMRHREGKKSDFGLRKEGEESSGEFGKYI